METGEPLTCFYVSITLERPMICVVLPQRETGKLVLEERDGASLREIPYPYE